MKKILTVLLALAACAGLILTRDTEPKMQVSTVQVRTISRKVEAVGTVGYERTYALTPAVTGTVEHVFVEKGDFVGKGQAVAEVKMLPEDAGKWMLNLQSDQITPEEMQEEILKICTIVSPADGVVTSLAANEGMQATPAQVLGSVSTEALNVTALVPESLRESIFVGQSALIRRGDRELSARITDIQPSYDAIAQYAVQLMLNEEEDALEAGMRVDVEIVVEECSAPSVPLQAVTAEGTVNCSVDGGVVAVPVSTGLCNEFYAQLLSGPPVGTVVVLKED